jgi:hypothetical protein
MLNEPRTYRHSPIRIGLIILVLGILSVGLLITMDRNNYLFLIPLAGFFGIIFLFVLFSMTKKTILSEDEISTQSFLGTKSLRWNEISRVSGRGYAIKLQNFDGDVTVAPSPQLPDYEEVVEWIGIKRPDLFNSLEYSEMAKSWASMIYLPLMGLLIIGMGFFILTQANDTFVPFIILVILGFFFIVSIFTAPQSLSLEGNSLLVKYLLNQKTFLADEIQSIDLKHQSTRNGKNYFVVINLVNKKTIRISGLYPNLPVAYLVLKNWHKKNTAIGLTTQQN